MKSGRFVLLMAAREGRAAFARLALLLAAVAVGVAALVAINSFTDNLLDSVRAQARALLGADLALSSGAPLSPKAENRLADLTRAATSGAASSAGAAEVQVARVTRFAAMAYAPKSQLARLVQVSAVEPGYPFYGRIGTEPAFAWDRLHDEGRQGAILADPSLLAAIGAEVGDELLLGEARLRIMGVVVDVPGDVSVRAAFGPRAFLPASRVEETRLLAFGSRARYEAYLRLPEAADAQRLAERFRPSFSAERVTLRTVEDDQGQLTSSLGRLGRYLGLVALVALLLGGLGVASAVHVFVKRKMETIAVLRCLGASGRKVMAVYLVQSAALGLLGSLLGAGARRGRPARAPASCCATCCPSTWSWLRPGRPSRREWAWGCGRPLAFALLPLLGVRDVSPLAVLRRPFEPARAPRRDRWRILAAVLLGLSVATLAVLQAGRLGPGLSFAAGIGTALLSFGWVLWRWCVACGASSRAASPTSCGRAWPTSTGPPTRR